MTQGALQQRGELQLNLSLRVEHHFTDVSERNKMHAGVLVHFFAQVAHKEHNLDITAIRLHIIVAILAKKVKLHQHGVFVRNLQKQGEMVKELGHAVTFVCPLLVLLLLSIRNARGYFPISAIIILFEHLHRKALHQVAGLPVEFDE